MEDGVLAAGCVGWAPPQLGSQQLGGERPGAVPSTGRGAGRADQGLDGLKLWVWDALRQRLALLADALLAGAAGWQRGSAARRGRGGGGRGAQPLQAPAAA